MHEKKSNEINLLFDKKLSLRPIWKFQIYTTNFLLSLTIFYTFAVNSYLKGT